MAAATAKPKSLVLVGFGFGVALIWMKRGDEMGVWDRRASEHPNWSSEISAGA